MNKIKDFLNRDVKEFNGAIVVMLCVLFLTLVGIISYEFTNSFALFTDTVTGEKTITLRYTGTSEASETFGYTGSPEEYIAPRDGYYYIELMGAAGGSNSATVTTSYGSKTSGYIKLKAGEKIYFYVGKKGTNIDTDCSATTLTYNGGGKSTTSNGKCGPTGGGATDVRLVNGSWDNTASLISRIMVAAGGAGSDSNVKNYSGSGGTLYGETPSNGTTSYNTYLGKPGTQTSGGAAPTKHSTATSTGTAGSFGKGGSGGASASTTTSGGGAGGGGGYYGGSGSSGLSTGTWSAGGGSSYISGYAGVNSVEENTTITHTNQTLHYSGKYFIGGDMVASQNDGDGSAKIEFIGSKPVRINTALNNVRYVRDCISYNTVNAYNHWTEIQAIKDGVNIAKGKTVSGITVSDSGTLSRVNDGIIGTASTSYISASTQATGQCVQVDLGSTYNLDEVAVWNFFSDNRRYISNNFQVSDSGSTWRTLSNDEVWVETSNGARYNAYIDHLNGYTGRSYMTLWYDGIANTNGTTRNYSTTTWKNLAVQGTTFNGAILNGTAAGATWGGKYLTLDGSNDWVRIGAMNYTAPTIEAVFMPLKSHTGESVIAANFESGGYGLKLNAGNAVAGQAYAGGWAAATSGKAATTNKIGQYATYFNAGTVKIFRDGAFPATATASATTITSPTNSTVMALGTNPSGTNSGGSWLNARVYSVRIYNGLLTDDQIYRNYLYDKQRFNFTE